MTKPWTMYHLMRNSTPSNFWLYWQTMFAFEKWHSALEMKLYIQRFIHHIGGLPDFSALKFTQIQPVRIPHPPHGPLSGGPQRPVSV